MRVAPSEAPRRHTGPSRWSPDSARTARWVLGLLGLVQLLLVLPALREGLLADHDFVAHYSYLWLLVHRQLPAGEGLFGWTTAFNTGTPFLLFNIPPLTTLLAYALSLGGSLSLSGALKALLVAGYLATPALTRWVALGLLRSRAAALFAAVLVAFASSELFGFYFFFSSGMVNASLGLVLALLVLGCGVRVVGSDRVRRRDVAGLALGVLACLLTHVQSCYMALLLLGAVLLVEAARRRSLALLGARGAWLGVGVALGVGLAGFWLVPSAPVAEPTERMQLWARSGLLVLRSLLRGDLLGGAPFSFYDRLVHGGRAAGHVLAALALLGAACAVRRRAPLGLVAGTLLSFWVVLGPEWAGPLKLLPLYPKLLQFRFLTLFVLCCVLLGGLALEWLWRWRVGRLAAAACVAVLALNTLDVSRRVRTEADYPAERRDLEGVAAWLTRHGDRRGRLYSEFLDLREDGPSVNYLRQLLPVRSGFDEVVGWVYENSPASTLLVRRGLYWYSGGAMLDVFDTYNVKYVAAGSDALLRLARADARWREVLTTPTYALFEARDYTPDLLGGLPHRTLGWRQPRPSAYVIDFERPAGPGGPLTAKVGFSAYWRATLDGQPVQVRQGPEGLLEVAAPAALAPGRHRLELTWEHAARTRAGVAVSVLAALLLALLVLPGPGGWLQRVLASGRVQRPLGMAALAVLLLALGASWRNLRAPLLHPYAGGSAPVRAPEAVQLGTYDDVHPQRATYLVGQRWGERALAGGRAGRTLRAGASPEPDVHARVGDPRHVRVTVDFAASSASLEVALGVPGAPPGPWARAVPGVPTLVGLAPGVRAPPFPAPLALWLKASQDVFVHALRVDSGLHFLEAETFVNAWNDGGTNFVYASEGPRAHSNHLVAGMAMRWPYAGATLQREVTLPSGRYTLWAQHATYPGPQPGVLEARYAGRSLGPAWQLEPGPLGDSEWVPLGALEAGGEPALLEVTVRRTGGRDGPPSGVELDTFALVPAVP